MNKKLFHIISIVVAVFGVLFGGYNFYIDSSSYERVKDARMYLDRAKEILAGKSELLDSKMQLEMSYINAKRGVSILNNLIDQKTIPVCPRSIRKEAILELLNYYELYPNNKRFEENIVHLKHELDDL